MAGFLQLTTDDSVRTLTLNRPEVLNAFNAELRADVANAVTDAATDPEVRVIILAGAGQRAFSSGQDINEAKELRPEDAEDWQKSWRNFYGSFVNCNKPIIAAVGGIAAGGGFVIAALSDIRVMAESARFSMAEINMGLPAILGSHCLFNQIFLSRTIEIVLSGRDLSADEARRIGFAHEVVPAGEELARARELADELVEKAATPLRLTVTRFREIAKREFKAVADAYRRYQTEAVASGEPQRVMTAFLEERGKRKQAR